MNDRLRRILFLCAACAGMIGVIMGAFGAHVLKDKIPTVHLEAVKTGVLYLFVHALAAVFGLLRIAESFCEQWLKRASVFFLTGILLFSGSLFLIGTSTLTHFPVTYIGFLTPLGGICFIGGWVSWILAGRKSTVSH